MFEFTKSYLSIKIERISVLSWNPTSHKASLNLSALRIPVFSFVCILKTPCHVLRFTMKSLKSLNVILERFVLSIRHTICRHTSKLAQLRM